jgi:glycosyltransferase involved in cell wall biosynthesis
LISFIVVTFNQSKYLRETLESIKSQTNQDFEIIFVDDGSKDNCFEIAENFAQENKELKISLFRTNDVGASNARHFAIQQSGGDYYVPLDGDDLIEPDFLEKTLPLLESNKEIGFIYPDTIYFGDQNQRYSQQEYNFFNLIFNNFISYCCLIRRKAYECAGGYNLKNRNYFEDWELWIRMGRKGWYGKHLPEPLFKYRVHKKSSSQTGFAQRMGNAFKAYIKTQYPELYPPNLVDEAKQILLSYEPDFMSKQRS